MKYKSMSCFQINLEILAITEAEIKQLINFETSCSRLLLFVPSKIKWIRYSIVIAELNIYMNSVVVVVFIIVVVVVFVDVVVNGYSFFTV